jgi:hypothetical protein
MNVSQATLAAIPPALAIYFEVMNASLVRRVRKEATALVAQILTPREVDYLISYRQGEWERGNLPEVQMRIGIEEPSPSELRRGITNNFTESVAAFGLGMFSVFSFRPTVVSVASTSLAIIYELHDHGSFFATVGLVVALLVLLPIFSGVESSDFLEAATPSYRPHRSWGRTTRNLVSLLIIGLNFALMILIFAVLWLTHTE